MRKLDPTFPSYFFISNRLVPACAYYSVAPSIYTKITTLSKPKASKLRVTISSFVEFEISDRWPKLISQNLDRPLPVEVPIFEAYSCEKISRKIKSTEAESERRCSEADSKGLSFQRSSRPTLGYVPGETRLSGCVSLLFSCPRFDV